MALEHQVWAVPLGKETPVFISAYEMSRWQWAEKCAQQLRDKGHDGVEVRTVEEDAEPEPEQDG
jgi:hypothetical protein